MMFKGYTMIYLICLIIVAADQLIKLVINNKFICGQSLPVIKNIFHLTYVKNTGAAFGIFQNQNMFFIISTLVIIVIMLIYINIINKKSIWFKLAAGLILGGAVANLIDRIRVGCVIDYLDFRIWPVFNLADSTIVIGAGIMILLFMMGEEIL